MRWWIVPVALAAALALGAPAEAARCAPGAARVPAALPAPVAVVTGCGRFLLAPGQRARLLGPARHPVPAGVEEFPDLSWFRLEDGRVAVGRGRATLWRSQERFGPHTSLGALALSTREIAFSSAPSQAAWKRPALYLARLGGGERFVAGGETPVGWTAAGSLVTWSRGELRVRSASGALLRTLARGVSTFAFDRAAGAVVFVAHGRLLRFAGRRPTALGTLAAAGLRAPVVLEPLGRLVAVRGVRRLAVFGAGGGLVSETALPRGTLAADRVSSEVAADGRGDVAFAATRGNTALGSAGTETVYLLRPGARRATPLHSERVRFGVCERQATLAWHGRWLLYSTSEGYAAAVDSTGGRAVELSGITRRLLGWDGDFAAAWR